MKVKFTCLQLHLHKHHEHHETESDAKLTLRFVQQPLYASADHVIRRNKHAPKWQSETTEIGSVNVVGQ